MRQGARCVQAQRRPNRCLEQRTYTQSQVAPPFQPRDKEAGWRRGFKGQQTHIISKVSFKYRIQLRLGWPWRPLLFLPHCSGRIHTWGSWFWFAPVPDTPAATTERTGVNSSLRFHVFDCERPTYESVCHGTHQVAQECDLLREQKHRDKSAPTD